MIPQGCLWTEWRKPKSWKRSESLRGSPIWYGNFRLEPSALSIRANLSTWAVQTRAPTIDQRPRHLASSDHQVAPFGGAQSPCESSVAQQLTSGFESWESRWSARHASCLLLEAPISCSGPGIRQHTPFTSEQQLFCSGVHEA